MSRDERWAKTAVNCQTLVLFLELCQLSSPRPRTCLPWSSGCRYCNWSPASLPLTLAARSRVLLLLPGFNQEGILALSLTSHTNLSALPVSRVQFVCLFLVIFVIQSVLLQLSRVRPLRSLAFGASFRIDSPSRDCQCWNLRLLEIFVFSLQSSVAVMFFSYTLRLSRLQQVWNRWWSAYHTNQTQGR